MNWTLFFLAAISPLLIALIRRCQWPKELVEILAVLAVVLLAILGRWLDGALDWPLDPAFLVEILSLFGVQQVAYKLGWRRTGTVEALEQVGQPQSAPQESS